jgi:SAM-dependent methyltransferase
MGQVIHMEREHPLAERWAPQAAPGETFGAGRSERCVEVPWAQSWLTGRKRIMDIGFALSDLSWLRVLLGQQPGAEITAVDIVQPERVANRYPDDLRAQALAVPVVIGDVRTAPVPAGSFDTVTCISTIEHIGFDAAGATDESAFARWKTLEETPTARDPAVTGQVMAAIARALAPGGLALVTVPMGKGGAVPVRDSLGFYTRQLEYDATTWPQIAEAPGFRLLEQRFFACSPDGDHGWSEAEGPADLAGQTAWLTPHALGVALVALERTA